MVRFTKFEKWLNQQDNCHLDLYKVVTFSSYEVAKKIGKVLRHSEK